MTSSNGIRRDHLVSIRRLPETSDVEFAVESARIRDLDTEWLDNRLLLCRERDTLQADRPEGCWCLGLGESYGSDGDVFPARFCTCDEGIAAEHALSLAEKTERNARKTRRWAAAGVPKRFRDFSYETMPAHLSDVTSVMRGSAVHEESSWFLHGPYGRGKTGAAVAYAREWADHHDGPVRFLKLPDLLSRLRSTYDHRPDTETEEDVLRDCRSAALLILDDIGAEARASGGEWLMDRLYQIIGGRHDEELATVFTSNLDIKGLVPRIGERVAWRLVGMVGRNVLHLTGPNLREVTR
jgi:DNA replication protein DnaC